MEVTLVTEARLLHLKIQMPFTKMQRQQSQIFEPWSRTTVDPSLPLQTHTEKNQSTRRHRSIVDSWKLKYISGQFQLSSFTKAPLQGLLCAPKLQQLIQLTKWLCFQWPVRAVRWGQLNRQEVNKITEEAVATEQQFHWRLQLISIKARFKNLQSKKKRRPM